MYTQFIRERHACEIHWHGTREDKMSQGALKYVNTELHTMSCVDEKIFIISKRIMPPEVTHIMNAHHPPPISCRGITNRQGAPGSPHFLGHSAFV